MLKKQKCGGRMDRRIITSDAAAAIFCLSCSLPDIDPRRMCTKFCVDRPRRSHVIKETNVTDGRRDGAHFSGPLYFMAVDNYVTQFPKKETIYEPRH